MSTKQIMMAAGAGLVIGGVAYYFLKVRGGARQAETQQQSAGAASSSPVDRNASAAGAGMMPPPPEAKPIEEVEFPLKMMMPDGQTMEIQKDQATQLLGAAMMHKQQGNDLLNAGKLDQAIQAYSTAIQMVMPLEQVLDAQPIFLACCSNMILAFTKLEKFEEAIGLASSLIEDPRLCGSPDFNRKIHYRRAQANRLSGKKEAALADYQKCLSLDPDEKSADAIKSEIELCK